MNAQKIRERRHGGVPFLGREDERLRVDAALGAGRPLITIVGPPGVGKTALARWTCVRVEDEGRRVLEVALSASRSTADVARAMAAAIPLDPDGKVDSDDPPARVGRALGAMGPVLVWLDDVDICIDSVRSVLDGWLDDAPEAQWLITSRERLGALDEWLVELGGLALGTTGGSDDAALAMWEACVSLHVPSYRVDAAEADAVRRILREVDCIPLAIELAAARYGTMPLATLEERLRASNELLRGPVRGADPIHLAFERLWSTFHEWERSAFVQLSVMGDRIDLPAAEATVDLTRIPDAPPMADVLQHMRGRSLLRLVQDGPGSADPRLGWLRTTRRFAQEKLSERANPHELGAMARFAAHCATQVTRLADATRSPAAPQAIPELRRTSTALLEHIDVWLGDEATFAAAAQVLIAFERGLRFGPAGALLDRVDRALVAPRAPLPASIEARLRLAHARACRRLGRLETAADDLSAAEALIEAHHLTEEGVLAKRQRAQLEAVRGNATHAMDAAEEALALAATVGTQAARAEAHFAMAFCQHRAGAFAAAAEHAQSSVQAFRSADDLQGELMSLTELVSIATSSADLGLVASWSVRIKELRLVVTEPSPTLDHTYALCALAEGRWERAATMLDQVAHELSAWGEREDVAWVRAYRAIALRESSGADVALAELRPALLALRSSASPYVPFAYAILGTIEASAGREAAADEAFERAEAAIVAHGDLVADAVALCRAQLDLCRATQARLAGDAATADSLRARAKATLADAKPGTTVEALVARRWIEDALTRDPQAPTTPFAAPVLRYAELGGWFEISGGTRVDCTRRPVMRRLLLALVAQREREPGRPMSPDALYAAGWPGDLATPSSARNRLHVMVSRIREEGLRLALQSSDEGYWLDATMELDRIRAK